MKKVLKIVLYSLLGFLTLLLLLAALSQTQFFRDRLRAVALSQLDSLLYAEVHLGELTGNLVSGFSLDHISIKVQNDFLLSAERLDIKYDLFGIPGKVISVDNITLVHASVSLLRGRDGVWNFKRMIRPTEEDTTAPTPFDWKIIVNKLELQGGTVILVDSAALAASDHDAPDPEFVEYHNFQLRDFNLTTSAKISKDEKQAAISALSFNFEEPKVRLERLSGDFSVTSTGASVKNLVIKTGRSFVQISAQVREFDLFGGIELNELQNNPVELSLKGNDIDMNELQRFIPQIHFLNGLVTFDLEASGEFGELNVKRLEVLTGQTALHLSGTVFNLHRPSDLLLNVKCTESKIYSPDVLALLPKFDLPDYRHLGVMTLNFDYAGRPLDFQTKLYLETTAGNVNADVNLKIGGPGTLAYKAQALLQRLDVGQVLSNDELASRLNGAVEVSGEGVSMEELKATAKVHVDSSEFRGQPVGPSEVTVDAANSTLSSTISLALGSSRSDVKVVLDQQDKNSPAFSVEGKVSSLNLEDFLHDKSLSSDLTMNITASGSGFSWDKLNGDFHLDFSPSRFGNYKISSGNIRLDLDQKNPASKQLKMESNIADFSIAGAYDVEYLMKLISFELRNLRAAVSEKFAVLDSSLRTSAKSDELAREARTLAATKSTLNASFSLRLKDLEPLSIVTGNKRFNGVGDINGWVKGGYHNLDMHMNVALRDFFYGNVDGGFLLNDASGVLDIGSLRPVDPLKFAAARYTVSANRMHVNEAEFDKLSATLAYENELLNFSAGTTVDQNLHMNVDGRADVSEDAVLFTLNDLGVAFQDYAWKADKGVTVGFNSRGVRVKDLVMRRDSQAVALNGELLNNGMIAATLTAIRVNLNGLRHLMGEEEAAQNRETLEGSADVIVRASGTLDAPEFTSTARVDGISYRTVAFGTVTGDLIYKSELLSGQMQMRGPGGVAPSLTAAGLLPINLALQHVETRLLDRPMDISIKSSGVQMSILDPLLPTFNQLTGMMRCDMKLVGSPAKPNYEGTLRIDSCGFLFIPNNIHYTFEGRFQPNGERIKVVEAAVRNIPSDRRLGRQGEVKITGDFTFSGFKPSDFDLTAKGSLLVVKETTRKSALSVYGNLFIELGPAGLHYTGNIENSLLRGYILISNSSLVFPPTQSSTAQTTELSLPTVVIDDTTKVTKPAQDRSWWNQYFGSGRESTVKLHTNGKNGLPSKSFLEGVHYDLDVESTGGNTEIRMIFFAATGEELVANVTGRISILEDGKRWTGEMTIDRAYYNFYKRFEAEGTIRYRGEFMNPELDIKAEYQGTRTIQDSTADKTEKVVVNLKITGTRKEPKLDISMTIDGVDYYAYSGLKSADVSSDALQFLIAGNFPLTQSQKNDVASTIGSTVGGSLVTGATSLLSSNLSDFLRRETGFISSIELSYGAQGTFGESADIRVSGVAAGGLWRYGGKILNDPFSNANVSILYSFGKIFDKPVLRNFMFELERRVETSTIGQIGERKEINSARLFYRFSF